MEEKQIQKYEGAISLVFGETPEKVLGKASFLAKKLKTIIKKCQEPYSLIVEIMNKEGKKVSEHLRFEAWQTLGASVNIFAKPVEYEKIENGWKVKAQAIHFPTQKVVSEAIAICSRDESNWSSKPEFQLLSMAQTRACAKALRNCLAWIVVLAGYSPTPAEELTNIEPTEKGFNEKEKRRILAEIKKLEKISGKSPVDLKSLSLEELIEYREQLLKELKEKEKSEKGELL